MKKIIFLLALVLILTGCSIEEINKSNLDNVIESVTLRKNNLSNVNAEGYKYYLPRGMRIVDKAGYNTKFQYEGNDIYLYIDAIAYYHDINKEYKINDKSYYSSIFTMNDKKGYIEINKVEDKYFLEILYNYGRIEAYVKEKDLNSIITNTLTILETVKYNDEVLATLIGENALTYQEEALNIFESKREEGTWLEYEKEYGTYDDEKSEQKSKEEVIIPIDNY